MKLFWKILAVPLERTCSSHDEVYHCEALSRASLEKIDVATAPLPSRAEALDLLGGEAAGGLDLDAGGAAGADLGGRESFAWIAERGLFEAGTMGTGNYEQSVVSFAGV